MDKGLPPSNQPPGIHQAHQEKTESPDKTGTIKFLPEPKKRYRHKPIPGKAVLITEPSQISNTGNKSETKTQHPGHAQEKKTSPELTVSKAEIKNEILSSLPGPWKQLLVGNPAELYEAGVNQQYQAILDNYQSRNMKEGLAQLINDLALVRSIAEQLAANKVGSGGLLTAWLDGMMPIQDFWAHCLQCSNTQREFSPSHPQHQLISDIALPKKGTQLDQQDANTEAFNQDFHRNMEITAYSRHNKLVFHARVRNGEYQFLHYREDNRVREIRFNLLPGNDEDAANNPIDKTYFSQCCQDAIAEFADNEPILTSAILDLATQTADNTLWLFFDQVYGPECHAPSPLSPVRPQGRTDFYAQAEGSVTARLTLQTSGFEVMTDEATIHISQSVTISTQIQLNSIHPAEHKMGDITVQMGKLKSIQWV